MEPSRLGLRIRDVLRQGSARPAAAPSAEAVSPEPVVGAASALADVLGGTFCEMDGVSCFVVERAYPADRRHGAACIGDHAQAAARFADQASVLSPGTRSGAAAAAFPFLFFDLETTGLSGGAGTHAFLVGCGFFEAGGFRTQQFFLTSYAAERALLLALSSLLGRIGVLVTFNGKSFDIPVIETRYLFHRLALPATTRAHLDMLHPARQLWRGRRERGAADDGGRGSGSGGWSGAQPASLDRCTLGALERSVLGVRRRGDVPGSEIPSRYFHYIRTGCADPLEAVFEHNRLDLLSLAGLTARGLHLAADGPAAAQSARECLALGRMYERVGRGEAAVACYRRAVEPIGAAAADDGGHPDSAGSLVRADAMRRLALLYRRRQRHLDAVELWERLITLPECPPGVAREAAQALAVHHEHRSKDLAAARRYACRSLADAAPHVARDARRRLARVDRKLAAHGLPVSGTLLSAYPEDVVEP